MYYKRALKKKHWNILKNELIKVFSQNTRDTSVTLEVQEWPPFVQKEHLIDKGLIPALITGSGPLNKICLKNSVIHPLAFDEEFGHLSHLFTGRLYNLVYRGKLEKCVISNLQSDPVEKSIYFIKFKRHIEGQITEVDIPCTLVGLLASPAYLKGYHVELMMPTIKCEVAGSYIPPPFQIDVSKLDYEQPFKSLYLKDIESLLPDDDSVLFHRSYDLDTQEVVCTYLPGTIPEQPLPPGYLDPNFLNKKGRRIHLTYKGFFPKQ